MRLVGAVNVYNDAPLLRESLPVLRSVADYVVLVDGRYDQFPDEWRSCASNDGTLDVARELADIVIECKKPWPSEIEKRNAYLSLCRDEDYLLVVDADEILEGDDLGSKPSVNCDLIMSREDWLLDLYREENVALRQPIHRLFKWRPGIAYRGAHHAVHVGDSLIRPCNLQIMPGLVLKHCQNRRCKERASPKGKYYDWLANAERYWRSSTEAQGMDRTHSQWKA